MKIYGPPKEVIDGWSMEKKEMARRMVDNWPVRLAVLDDVEWGDLSVKRLDEGSKGTS